MPDSNETAVDPQTSSEYENRFQNGDPPTDDFGPPIETTEVHPRNQPPGLPTVTIEQWFYSNVTCNPGPEIVLETCDQCGGHVHEVKILFGQVVGTPAGGIRGPEVEDQQHAGDDHFGQHLGELFVNSRCKGKEITRTRITSSVTGRSIGGWRTKTIDHVKNGFVWLSDISKNPCESRKELGEFMGSEFLESALGEESQ